MNPNLAKVQVVPDGSVVPGPSCFRVEALGLYASDFCLGFDGFGVQLGVSFLGPSVSGYGFWGILKMRMWGLGCFRLKASRSAELEVWV